jgi:FixJ family two-component response regulator
VANWLIGNAVVTAKTLSVRMVIRGQPNKQIAWAIACIERTVKAHRHNVIEKIQVKTLAEVVSAAARVGIASATKQTE